MSEQDIAEHKKAFDEILKKYDLRGEEKAAEIADFLTSHSEGVVSVDEFATLFNMDKKDAHTFLAFITRGLQFKEKHIDNSPHKQP